MVRFVIKHRQEHIPVKRNISYIGSEKVDFQENKPINKEEKVKEPVQVKEDISQINSEKNNKEENKVVMNTAEKVEMANKILAQQESMPKQKVKKIRKDKGLIERTESSKTILTEDNKELLID